LGGSALILALDAFFPFDSLGPLQIIVPIYLQIDQAILNFLDTSIFNVGPESTNNSLQPAMARGNLLVLNGLHGPFALQVFWPSAGVHSIIIYTLVMLALLIKLDIPLARKIIYFAVGTLGTIITNLVRIVSLSLYALVVTTNIQQWEAFHSMAGEIMFLPWLGVYLAVVIYIENKRLRRLRAGVTSAPASNQPVL
jgi:thaumarchaeosortase